MFIKHSSTRVRLRQPWPEITFGPGRGLPGRTRRHEHPRSPGTACRRMNNSRERCPQYEKLYASSSGDGAGQKNIPGSGVQVLWIAATHGHDQRGAAVTQCRVVHDRVTILVEAGRQRTSPHSPALTPPHPGWLPCWLVELTLSPALVSLSCPSLSDSMGSMPAWKKTRSGSTCNTRPCVGA